MANDTANVVDLVQGRRYEIYPNQPRYTQAEFQSYRLRLENDKDVKFESDDVEACHWWANYGKGWWFRGAERVGLADFGPLAHGDCSIADRGFVWSQSTAGTLLPSDSIHFILPAWLCWWSRLKRGLWRKQLDIHPSSGCCWYMQVLRQFCP